MIRVAVTHIQNKDGNHRTLKHNAIKRTWFRITEKISLKKARTKSETEISLKKEEEAENKMNQSSGKTTKRKSWGTAKIEKGKRSTKLDHSNYTLWGGWVGVGKFLGLHELNIDEIVSQDQSRVVAQTYGYHRNGGTGQRWWSLHWNKTCSRSSRALRWFK